MIESIELRNVATYNHEGIVIKDLKKINFIYGANGVGKTTISQLVHEGAIDKYTNCSIKWKDGVAKKVLVYNKDFKDRNLGKGI